MHCGLAHQLAGSKEGAGLQLATPLPPPKSRPLTQTLTTLTNGFSCFLMGQAQATTLPTAQGGGEETLEVDGDTRASLKKHSHGYSPSHAAQVRSGGCGPRLKLTRAM